MGVVLSLIDQALLDLRQGKQDRALWLLWMARCELATLIHEHGTARRVHDERLGDAGGGVHRESSGETEIEVVSSGDSRP